MPLRRSPGFHRIGPKVSGDLIQPNTSQVPHQLIYRLGSAVINDQVEIPTVREKRAGPGGERPIQGEVDRARHGAQSELASLPGVHDRSSLLQDCRERGTRETCRPADPTQERWARLIYALHVGEVARRIGLACQDGANELVFVGDAEGPVEALLIAECCLGDRAERLAARGARAVARPDLQIIRQLPETLQ
jgi:hypothetical protein